MSIYDSLNPMQREAVWNTDGPLLILAGAGSGKTRVLTHRIAYMIEEEGVNPWNILAITFTNKAAEEMRDRVDQLVGFGAESVWVATFHATCVRILRRYIDVLGYERNFSIYDTDDQRSVIKRVIKSLELDPKLYKERSVLSGISAAKNEFITPEEMELSAGADFYRRQLSRIYREYQTQLQKNNALDFDDLLMKTVELFQEHPDILEYYQQRFRYILVDEYQDTNTVQFQLLKLLAHKYQNLCVVGDDDQSIYKFRGANISNILSFEDTFPDSKVIKLEQNYRSTTAILDVANSVIRNNTGRKDKRLWSQRGQGDIVRFRRYENAAQEAGEVLGEIQRAVYSGKAQFRDYAILYRTNAQSRAFEEACVRASVPYRVVGGVNFYQRLEIKDVLAYLKTIDNARDDLAVRRILNVPKRGIGVATMDKIQAYSDRHGFSFFDGLQMTNNIPGVGRAAAKIKGFLELINLFRSQREYMGPADLIREILDQTDYLAQFEDNEDPEQIMSRRENLDEMIGKAENFEENYEKELTDDNGGRDMLSAFLEEVALVADIDSVDTEADRLMLMTLHGAKGLEFPRVYLCGMEDGLFPSYLSIDSDDPSDIEEERRLCYVGITRAMDQLTLTAAKLRMVRGETRFNGISRFVKEIPEELLDSNESFSQFGAFSLSGSKTAEGQSRYADEAEAVFGGFGRKRFGSGAQGGFSRNNGTKPGNTYSYGKSSVGGKEFAVTKSEGLDYKEGDRVLHVKFGEGTVLEIKEGKRDFEVTVLFDTAGQKRMFASFAKLVKKR